MSDYIDNMHNVLFKKYARGIKLQCDFNLVNQPNI